MNDIALLLIDFQNDYFSSFDGAKFELNNAEFASNNASKILNFFREKNLPVIHIQHIFEDENALLFVKDTKGSLIHKSVEPLNGEIVVTKNYPNSFKNTNLKEILDKLGIKSLVIVGAMSHMCIDATTRAASDFSYKCIVIDDAVATRDLKFDDIVIPSKYVHYTIMSALEFAYAKVTKTENLLKELEIEIK